MLLVEYQINVFLSIITKDLSLDFLYKRTSQDIGNLGSKDQRNEMYIIRLVGLVAII